MDIENEYGLQFVKNKIQNETHYFCNYLQSGKYYFVSLVLNQLSDFEVEAFIYDMDECIKNKNNGNTEFVSDGVGNMQINYSYPEVTINAYLGTHLVISMQDLKNILEEWRTFKKT